jgi:YspA, cpYpsA-related SLOG family
VRVLVCGGRNYRSWGTVYAELEKMRPTVVIHGCSTGADQFARDWALHNHVLIRQFPADWSRGPSAGPIRNATMILEGNPDVVLAFPGGRGTADMVRRARAANIRVIEVSEQPPSEGEKHGD